ncbi:transposase [Streptomyces sp. NPDC021093]|uniref:transposase n=1 Tax=Streptomyces sp. NPDC021093 TaxID=3365112 RepID=UPI00379AA9FB
MWTSRRWPPRRRPPSSARSTLPADLPPRVLVRLAKARWRIEHECRELETALGPDHFEGRSWDGWHRHVTLVTVAHLFLTEQCTDPKGPAGGLTVYQALDLLQHLLAIWTGRCPTCRQLAP